MSTIIVISEANYYLLDELKHETNKANRGTDEPKVSMSSLADRAIEKMYGGSTCTQKES